MTVNLYGRWLFLFSSLRKERTVAHYKAGNAARNYNRKRLFLVDKSAWKQPEACVTLSASSNSRIIRGLHGSASVARGYRTSPGLECGGSRGARKANTAGI